MMSWQFILVVHKSGLRNNIGDFCRIYTLDGSRIYWSTLNRHFLTNLHITKCLLTANDTVEEKVIFSVKCVLSANSDQPLGTTTFLMVLQLLLSVISHQALLLIRWTMFLPVTNLPSSSGWCWTTKNYFGICLPGSEDMLMSTPFCLPFRAHNICSFFSEFLSASF